MKLLFGLKSFIEQMATLLGLLALFGLAFWWEFYRYADCKAVGHSTTYCVLTIGR